MWGECCVGFGDDYGSLELMDPHRILLFHNSSKKKKEKKKKENNLSSYERNTLESIKQYILPLFYSLLDQHK